MNFDESVKYLYGLGNEVLAMKLGLENIGRLLITLGNPQDKYLKVQVAGTNGKGSTCAFLESICVEAKINVGTTTSPHLISVTERIKINGAEISENEFARFATKIRNISEKLVETGELETVPTYFEQVTAIALYAFAENRVELAILETGLGGRFDATTAAKAEIVAITSIDYDHQRILGNTLTEIAGEKAAIIRVDTKVVVAFQRDEAMSVVMLKCDEFQIKPALTSEVHGLNGRSPRVSKGANQMSVIGQQLTDLKTSKARYGNVKLGLLGKHQIENAKVAILLAEILQAHFPISTEQIIKGLENAKHQGRLEFCGNFFFDGAHNVSGAEALREFLDEFIDQPITMIFGSMRDKDLSDIAEILFPKTGNLILTKPDNVRAMETYDLAEIISKAFSGNVYQAATVNEALTIAENISDENDLILITGSLYLVGEAQKTLRDRSEI